MVTLEEQVKGMAKRGTRKAASPAKPTKPDDVEATPEPVAEKPETKKQPEPDAEAQKRAEALEEERNEALLKRVASAVENERIEAALQSVVTLPQRRARAYATLFNLKLDGAGTLDARHAVPAIEAAGASVDYDKAVVARALALAHKFAAGNRQPSSLCPCRARRSCNRALPIGWSRF